jgi:LuxR family maltose regulon positive regulatory protein
VVSRVPDLAFPSWKVEPPAPFAAFVPRERLRSLVEVGTAGGGVTTLCAPAGAGKTVLLADWARSGPVPTAWVSVDPADNEPGRLWTAVARAVARCVPELADPLEQLGADPAESLTPQALMSVLDMLPSALRLVLDDVEEVAEPRALDGLETLIRYRPTGLRLVLAGRTAPALPWPRLRLQAEVVDLDGDGLSFSLDEAAVLIARSGARMSASQVRGTHAMTGGRAAALRLIAAATRRNGEVGGAFSAETSLVAYLDEVLEGLADADRTLLRDVSVCDPVPPALAAGISGRVDAAAALERLASSTPLVVCDAVDGDVTVVALVRTSLYDELGRSRPEHRAQLHRRAADWYAANDRPAEAVDQARASGDDRLLAGLVRRWAVPMLLDGDHDTLRRACDALGPVVIADDDTLRLVPSALDAIAGGAADVPHDEKGPDGPAELRGLRAVAELDDLLAPDALAGPGDADDERPGQARATTTAALAAAVEGATRLLVLADPRAATALLTSASTQARALGHHYLAMQCASLLATAHAGDGDAGGMTWSGSEAVSTALAHGWQRSAWSISACSVLAHGSLLLARPADVRRHAAPLLAGPADTDPTRRLVPAVLLAAADADMGHPASGLEAMQQARTGVADRELPASQAALVAMLEHETAVAMGRPAHARAVRRWLAARVGPTGDVLLMSVRETVAAHPSVPVGRTLRPILEGTVPALLPDTGIESLLVEVADAHRAHDHAGARRLLIAALDLAAPRELMRPFTRSAGSVRELLAFQVGTFGPADGFARRALASGIQGRPSTPSPLSDRESRILHLLPSLATTTEIAADLCVSPNTVKSQVGAIYSKLGVNDRRAAVVAAYDAGLLADTPAHSRTG